MTKKDIVTGQRMAPDKLESARQLRRQQTSEEALLWRRLKANRLDGLHFRRQQVIDGFVVDFYCHEVGLVIEVDGAVHDTRREEDTHRDAVLRARGLTVTRFLNEEIQTDIETVLRRILDATQRPPKSSPSL